MSTSLRIGLLIASIVAMMFVLVFIIKRKLKIKYSMVWILWALLSLIMSIFPSTFYELAHLLGIEMPVNAVFLIMIALLYGLTFYVYCTISKHNEEIIKLTYEVANLKKEINELKNK